MTTLYTLGHSTRSEEDFRELLTSYGVNRLVDVRRFPGSRRFPHFTADALAASLGEVGIEYIHEPGLGGRRDPSPESPNTYWRNTSFRAYADYMASPEFEDALRQLAEYARERPTAILCAEAVPWRCHRQLIADALSVQGFEVIHIIDRDRRERHTVNPQARIKPDGHLIYPAPPEPQQSLFST